MGIISEKTERKALLEMARTLRFFERLELLHLSAGDSVRIAHAEYIIRDIIGNNGYVVMFSGKKGTKIVKLNLRS
ncbi:hypothetical protein ACTJKC_02785 [Pedobacter sp. 22226]|uniref:hypothetical protein n=1 Tax=Pedobacter sp. 22226 TaxID=3453894 RepID=UPI003F861FD7